MAGSVDTETDTQAISLDEGEGEASFAPPDADQVRSYLEAHEPRPPSRWLVWGPLALLMAALVVPFFFDDALMFFVLLVLVTVVIVLANYRVRKVRELETKVAMVQEMVMLRREREALREAWRLLPKTVIVEPLYQRVIVAMAQCLDRLQAHEASIAAHDYLIDHLPGEHPGVVQLRLVRAIAYLMTDRLADADDELRRLRGMGLADGKPAFDAMPSAVETDESMLDGGEVPPAQMQTTLGEVLVAGYHFVVLLQAIRTHHSEDAVEGDGDADLVQTLRPLGVNAGYGYALRALAHYRLAQQLAERNAQAQAGEAMDGDIEGSHDAASPIQQRREHIDAAKLWWSRATLLLRPEAIAMRYEDLKPLVADPELQSASRSAAPPQPMGSEVYA